MGKIGFLAGAEKKETEPEIVVANVEKDFSKMISELEVEENMQSKLLAIEKAVRKELIRLYKKIKKMEKRIKKRNTLFLQCQTYSADYPQKSLELLNQIEKLDAEIIPEADKLYKEISQHTLSEVADVYKQLDLSNEEIKHIRFVSNSLAATFSTLMRPVHEAVQGQQIESFRRNILLRHPDLK
ncbi:hypothetical protein HYX14_04635 [Candidatus Woesearchaeota archaeon]|nr:hypothetical protein [Candidatus Woesearchaeota archaeon]